MKALHIYIILLFVCLGFSCKKKDYPENVIDNAPVFYFKGELNGMPVSYTAGQDDYYMFSSYTQDTNNVYCFSGFLKKHSCDSCANRLDIQLRDFKVSPVNGPINIDASLKKGMYPVFANVRPYLVKFQSAYNKTASSYLWDFGDGSTSTDVNPEHVYKKKGTYKISLKITGTNSCGSTISSIKKIGYDTHGKASISSNNVGVNTLGFQSLITGGINPLKYLWNFGDGGTSTQKDPVHTFPRKGSYPVTLMVIDGANDTTFANFNAVTFSDVSSCAANFTLVSETAQSSAESLGLSCSVFKWYANGKVYTSSDIRQPDESYFEVLSVDDYDNNENDQKTKKITARFQCTVFNGDDYIKIKNAEAVIAVSYK